MRFPKLFEPGRIGALVTPSRIVFAATSSELADSRGYVSDEMVEYYAERARGGVGLVVVEATYVLENTELVAIGSDWVDVQPNGSLRRTLRGSIV